MAYTTRTVTLGEDWTLITNKIAMVQFNDEMIVTINEGLTPTGHTGIKVVAGENYTNPSHSLHLWAKGRPGGSNIESVRVVENE